MLIYSKLGIDMLVMHCVVGFYGCFLGVFWGGFRGGMGGGRKNGKWIILLDTFARRRCRKKHPAERMAGGQGGNQTPSPRRSTDEMGKRFCRIGNF